MSDHEDIAILDGYFLSQVSNSNSERAEKSWRRVRASLARAKRISSSSLPAVGGAVQHFVAARDHLSEGIEFLSGKFLPGLDEKSPDDET